MKFKLDENLSTSIIQKFSDYGYDAKSVLDEKISGCSDDDLYKTCIEESRCLISLDKDFSDVKRYPAKNSAGIVLLRLSHSHSLKNINKLLSVFLSEIKKNSVKGKLWIVETNRIRIRSEDDED
jgi:predicted nuclease of predicted toxin-antitoxin system